jgi:hypothetical protein
MEMTDAGISVWQRPGQTIHSGKGVQSLTLNRMIPAEFFRAAMMWGFPAGLDCSEPKVVLKQGCCCNTIAAEEVVE